MMATTKNKMHDIYPDKVVDIMLAKPKFAIPYLPEDRPFIVVSLSARRKKSVK